VPGDSVAASAEYVETQNETAKVSPIFAGDQHREIAAQEHAGLIDDRQSRADDQRGPDGLGHILGST
jgi:hypothetical protein